MSIISDRAYAAFRERWGTEPERVLVAPGRINIIGDHTDYSLLPVLPMAIQYGIAFAVGPGPDGLEIDSLNEPAPLVVGPAESTGEIAASWHRYVNVAVNSLAARPSGLRVCLVGDLPSTGGLSSSSALVVGLLAAITGDSDTPLTGQALADAAVRAERMAAIEGGAMDQTIIVFGEADAAVRLEFDPPQRRTVPIPDGLAFVAAYSGEQAAKGASAKDSYNTRVVACRASAALVADGMGADRPDPLVLGRVSPVPAELVEALPAESTAAEVAASTGTPPGDLVGMAAGDFPADRRIPIREVARHVVEEAAAVDAAEAALAAADFDGFGRLLSASHRSLRRFGSSTESLDRLTEAVEAAGALGARVTGAGFGGYAIAACRAEHTEAVLAAATATTGGPAFVVTPSRGIG